MIYKVLLLYLLSTTESMLGVITGIHLCKHTLFPKHTLPTPIDFYCENLPVMLLNMCDHNTDRAERFYITVLLYQRLQFIYIYIYIY